MIRRNRRRPNRPSRYPSPDDGTTTISAGGYFGQYLDMEVTAKNDIDLIKRYREDCTTPRM